MESEQDVPVTIVNSTFTGNRSTDEAAIDLDEGGDLLIVNSTFTGNIANEDGAISAEGGTEATVTLVYATVVGNIETEDDCSSLLPNGASQGAAIASEPEDVTEVEPQEAGEPANVSVGDTYTLVSFGSVVALPQGTVRRPRTARSTTTSPRTPSATTSPTTSAAGSRTSPAVTARTRATRVSGRWPTTADRPKRCCRRPRARG